MPAATKTSPPPSNAWAQRWRVIVAAGLGLASLVPIGLAHLPPGLSGLIAWNVAALAFLIPTLWIIGRDDEASLRRRAAAEDESQAITLAIVLSAVVAGLAGAVVALHESKGGHGDVSGARSWAWVFAISTVLLGWTLVQTVFTLHYAHRYFGDGDKDGEMDGGVKFPGDAPTNYRDFIYMAVCVGATAQVSDFNITNTRFRQLVTVHATLAFFFNSMVLALGINILATVIGQ
jgi:uncharacterized membrane protein